MACKSVPGDRSRPNARILIDSGPSTTHSAKVLHRSDVSSRPIAVCAAARHLLRWVHHAVEYTAADGGTDKQVCGARSVRATRSIHPRRSRAGYHDSAQRVYQPPECTSPCCGATHVERAEPGLHAFRSQRPDLAIPGCCQRLIEGCHDFRPLKRHVGPRKIESASRSQVGRKHSCQ